MTENNKQLEQQLWNIANTLRGKMGADDFRDYILGFIFYKYLSEKMHRYANKILEPDGIIYKEIDEDSGQGKQYLEAIRAEALNKLGYFLKPSELFSELARRGNGDGKSKVALGDWILGSVTRIAENGWGTFKPDDSHAAISIIPKMVSENGLNENDQIKVITQPSPDGSKTFIKAISREV